MGIVPRLALWLGCMVLAGLLYHALASAIPNGFLRSTVAALIVLAGLAVATALWVASTGPAVPPTRAPPVDLPLRRP